MYRSVFGILVLFTSLTGWSMAEDNAPVSPREIVEASGINGGLCVLIGIDSGIHASEYSLNGALLIQGLDPDEALVKKVQATIIKKGSYGPVSMEHWDAPELPYAQNLVNLLVILKSKMRNLKEAFRVLTPDGVVMAKDAELSNPLSAAGFVDVNPISGLKGWVRARKPRPKEMDEWTQYRHGPGRNPISTDSIVGPPEKLRWIFGPMRSRSHGGATGLAITKNGRLFYPHDEAESAVAGPMRLFLYARDAYNGLLLWKRPIPTLQKTQEYLNKWGDPFNRSNALTHLIADGDILYAVIESHGPLVILDAATGKTLRTFEKIRPTEMLLADGKLIVTDGKKVIGLDPTSGKSWSFPGLCQSIRAGDGKLFFVFERKADLVCLNIQDGKELWRTGKAELGRYSMHTVIPGMLIMGTYRGPYFAVSTKDGSKLWIQDGNARGPAYFFRKKIWIPTSKGRGSRSPLVNIDTATGKIAKLVNHPAQKDVCGSHDACTEKWYIHGRTKFIEWETGKTFDFKQARGNCGLGLIPANGLLYSWPTDCGCGPYLEGIKGVAAGPGLPKTFNYETPVHKKGPAFTKAQAASGEASVNPEDWPTWRGQASRGGYSSSTVPTDLELLWEKELGKKLTQSTLVDGVLFVVSNDRQLLFALDAKSGEERWKRPTPGAVNTPPTIYQGLGIFGCQDGWVYAVDVTDGSLAWRLRAAPKERKIIGFGRLESAWPVGGSVLIDGGLAFFLAGRHTELDGGVFAYAVKPKTGKVAWRARRSLKQPALCDLPVKGTLSIRFGGLSFDPKTGKRGREDSALKASKSFLDTAWAARRRWDLAGIKGSLLVFDSKDTYGIDVFPKHSNKHNLKAIGTEGYGFFKFSGHNSRTGKKVWKKLIPVRTTAMVKAGEVLFGVGIPDATAKDAPWAAFDGKLGAILSAYSAEDGSMISELKLKELPISDGLSVSHGRLYLSTTNGKVLCFGKR